MINDSSITKYANDNAKTGGRVYEVTLTEDMEVEVKCTTITWGNGVPVTKMFDNSKRHKLFIPAGTKLKGVAYTSNAAGCQMFDFPCGHTWYSTKRQAAKSLIAGRVVS